MCTKNLLCLCEYALYQLSVVITSDFPQSFVRVTKHDLAGSAGG